MSFGFQNPVDPNQGQENQLFIHTPATVLCCNCGQPMDGTKGLVMCYDCIRLTCDITQEIPREANVNFCRNCERFLQPPSQWVAAQLESRELLALLLRRLKGLQKTRLVDARFIWTEPHSRRIKVKLTVQGEAMANVIIQQSLEVEYVVIATQCPDCAKQFTVNTWRAAVQIRQKVTHKRTFFYLEQLILKHNAHMDTVSIKESRDGIDFYYQHKNHAVKMLDFLSAVSPMKYKRSEELISQDTHTGKSSYKFTFSVELVPICRDDLVIIPRKIAQSMGNISQVVICSRVTNSVQFLDPNTLQKADISSAVYWREPFLSLSEGSQLIEFIVLDIEPLGPTRGKYALADVVVARTVDLGQNTQTFTIRTHLGGLLHPGDHALGYYLVNANFNNAHWDELSRRSETPDVVLVKKFYPKRTKSSKRNWKLRRMAKEYNEQEDGSRIAQAEFERVERDYEMFLQELEEDEELRSTVNLYKKPNSQQQAQTKVRDVNMGDADGTDRISNSDNSDDEGADEGPTINVDELLDDLEGMTLEDSEMN
ncbi:ribosome-binding protein NMD3 [Sugiyamaella lignohabitans]|uniref:60S ribosomal export protein NMD3 n=1 Tax=Sugiyamaella lignohabitans TaxID=796027 RepID=A0A167FWC1_9ASCO|nr:ribosome-binding protein NMD3 [Sugiyamaella lignohabitans]ANB15784.1 ribosome-binding protein NMD3 [Sugiyamaella lignohabitans]